MKTIVFILFLTLSFNLSAQEDIFVVVKSDKDSTLIYRAQNDSLKYVISKKRKHIRFLYVTIGIGFIAGLIMYAHYNKGEFWHPF